MEAEKLSVKKHKKSSKRLHSFSSRSDDEDSRKNGYFKPSSVSSKKENLCDKSYLDVKEDRTKELESRIERKRKKGKVKERRSENEEYSSSSSSESQKQKKKIRKEKKRKEKKRKKKHKKEKVEGMNNLNLGSPKFFGEGVNKEGQKEMDNNFQSGPNPAKSTEEQKRRMAPMTKEEYDIQQSKVRRVLDPDTGRERLIKGDGEIIEDIVSYERHKAINKLSTAEDGVVFQKSVGLNR